MVEYPSSDPDLVLGLSEKAMNDTLGPEGLITSALVLVEYPKGFKKS